MFVQSTSHKQQNVTNELCELREESLMSSRSVSKPVCPGYEGTDCHIRPMTVLRSVSRKPVCHGYEGTKTDI